MNNKCFLWEQLFIKTCFLKSLCILDIPLQWKTHQLIHMIQISCWSFVLMNLDDVGHFEVSVSVETHRK